MRVAVLIASIVFITCANYACAYSIVITTIHNTTIYNRTDAIIYTSTEKSPVYKYLDNNISIYKTTNKNISEDSIDYIIVRDWVVIKYSDRNISRTSTYS